MEIVNIRAIIRPEQYEEKGMPRNTRFLSNLLRSSASLTVHNVEGEFPGSRVVSLAFEAVTNRVEPAHQRVHHLQPTKKTAAKADYRKTRRVGRGK